MDNKNQSSNQETKDFKINRAPLIILIVGTLLVGVLFYFFIIKNSSFSNENLNLIGDQSEFEETFDFTSEGPTQCLLVLDASLKMNTCTEQFQHFFSKYQTCKNVEINLKELKSQNMLSQVLNATHLQSLSQSKDEFSIEQDDEGNAVLFSDFLVYFQNCDQSSQYLVVQNKEAFQSAIFQGFTFESCSVKNLIEYTQNLKARDSQHQLCFKENQANELVALLNREKIKGLNHLLKSQLPYSRWVTLEGSLGCPLLLNEIEKGFKNREIYELEASTVQNFASVLIKNEHETAGRVSFELNAQGCFEVKSLQTFEKQEAKE